MSFKVVEKFVSVNGEGKRAGQLAVFIRFAHCNLNCSYCDTTWANEPHVDYELMTEEELYQYILSTKVKNITLTGGEPLLQKDLQKLLDILLKDSTLHIEIETNGSIPLPDISSLAPSYTMDYKLPSSGMEMYMLKDNLPKLTKEDTVKFVAGSQEDLERFKEIISEFNLVEQTSVYLSPVFEQISMEDMVNFMIDNNMNGVNLQIQLHKVIWEPARRGV